jgi:Rrf2 family nitric oxide-sensitive transcriptional repressor
MRLTTYTDFSLRVLIYVAVKPDPLPTIQQISASYGISKNHLMKVVHELGLAGYLRTTQGKGGGISLARPAQSIVLGELVRLTEPDMALMPCFAPVATACAIFPACKLKVAVQAARDAFLAVLDGYTLADLVHNRSTLRGLLEVVAISESKPPAARRSKAVVPSTRARNTR